MACLQSCCSSRTQYVCRGTKYDSREATPVEKGSRQTDVPNATISGFQLDRLSEIGISNNRKTVKNSKPKIDFNRFLAIIKSKIARNVSISMPSKETAMRYPDS